MPDIFLSYAKPDIEAASYLKRALEAEGLSVFLASEDIPPFAEWEAEIENNLKSMRAFVPLWTDDFEASKWAMMESTFAWFNRDSITIAPVMLGDNPPDHPTNRIQARAVQPAPDLPPMPSPDEYDTAKWPDKRWQSWAKDTAGLIARKVAE